MYAVSQVARVTGYSPSLGVGELLPFGVGGPMHGVRDLADLQALQLELTGKGPNAKRGYAHVDNGNVVIDWPYQDGGWADADPRTHADMLMVYGIDAKAPFYPTLLAKLGLDPRTPAKSWSTRVTRKTTSGGINVQGFDVGKTLGDVWNGVQQGVKTVGDVANMLHIPGANLYTALLTGGNLADALKADIDGFSAAAKIATAVATGNPSAIAASLAPGLTSAAARLGVKLNPSDVSAAVSLAQSVGDPTKIDPSKIVATAMGGSYKDAWNVATNFGKVASSLPAPPGLSYQAGASASAAASHPLTVAAKRAPIHMSLGNLKVPVQKPVIAMHLGVPVTHPAVASLPDTVGAKAGAYPPYKMAGAVHGLGDDLGRGGHGHGGGHGGRGGRVRPREFSARWQGPNGSWGPWPYEAIMQGEVTCTTWGDPVEMSPAMESVGQVQIRNSGGNPGAVRGADGITYLFQMEGGELTMRPCAAMSSTLGAPPDALYYLYRSTVPVGGWAIVGGWYTVDDVQGEMTNVLKSAPSAQLGAYVWDGRTMNWQAFT